MKCAARVNHLSYKWQHDLGRYIDSSRISDHDCGDPVRPGTGTRPRADDRALWNGTDLCDAASNAEESKTPMKTKQYVCGAFSVIWAMFAGVYFALTGRFPFPFVALFVASFTLYVVATLIREKHKL